MMHKTIVIIGALTVLLLVSHIFLTVDIIHLRKAVSDLETKTAAFEESLLAYQEHEDQLIEDIKHDIALLQNRSDAQFSKTVGMSKTYDAILEEQKKKTIDTAEQDKTVLEAKHNAVDLYKKGSYVSAYGEFNKLAHTYGDDMECRRYKAKSLFYMNRGDSSRYAEILEDIKVLKQNVAADDECLEIEKAILAEKEGFNG